jgi:transcriptional regulator with XRE-family HTH domain
MRGALANGDQLQAARASRGLTQEQLAALADVDVKTVRKAEQGKRLDLGTLTRLAFALDVELNQIIRPSRSETEIQIRRRDVVMRWHRAWDARDMNALLTLFHEHAIMQMPGGLNIPIGGTFRGKAEIRRLHEMAWSICETEPVPPEDFSLLVADDTVILQGRKGIRLPNGESVKLAAVHIFRFEGDLIAEVHVEYDTLRFAQLLGLPSPDASKS